ncbi:MAG: 4-hydroxythreonine-4-phosphate dehydrogenase PdxA, partial [Alphaproteobacteria bacterium]|nr:4-hydroxythreonine-4-phosphate dehydrogenase PdxA [Alphaproteobacteria bacterium]
DARNAPAIIAAIEAAVLALRAGTVDALATGPIAKSVLAEGGFGFPGHTEFLAHLAGRLWGLDPAPHPVMMLAGPRLRTVPITIHVPLHAVPALLDEALVLRTARIVAAALARDFGIARPRLALGGLNPHAGEAGRIGTEEVTVLAPAVARLRAEGIAIEGPLAADSLFHEAARARYDAALLPLHDQALIPVKTLDFDRTVNLTLGLPFVRTSPDHGTAFDIAGRGLARPEPFEAAIALARAIVRTRTITAGHARG